ncbi:MAG: molecular chaperone HtpG [Oscillospiraceae bacterium]|nr:molecular chaperone HtpG [Oscillospiraceae bacterium]
MAKKPFKAESARLLDLMINSIYTHQEVFLRELISNASDAIDKLCFLSLTDEKVGLERSDFFIRLQADKEARTLTVSDNGIGMSQYELENNLGVIARSGTAVFRESLDAPGKDREALDVIGRFGVGFYAAFMVASRVRVVTRRYGEETAHCWESDGADGYTVEECRRESVGTDVILYLKPDTAEEDYSQYLRSQRLRELVKKTSDYVRWPIRMLVEVTEKYDTGELDENAVHKYAFRTVEREETVNSMVPIWQRSRDEATDADCAEYYKESFHDSEDPVAVIRMNAEGEVSCRCLLFIPAQAPYDFYTRDYAPGLRLYANGVLIMEKCPDLLPDCFRFVRGIVDSPDLSLNISRELLQHDRQLKRIGAGLEKKVRTELKKLLDTDRERYERFYAAFGLQLRYGILADYSKKDMLTELLLYWSAEQGKLVSLKEYVERMPESQSRIYYAVAESVQRAALLPQTEPVRARGYDVLCFDTEADEFVAELLGKFEDKRFCSVSSQDLGLESEEDRARAEKAREEYRELLAFVAGELGDRVARVRISPTLRRYAACLTVEGEITLEMERYFHALPGANPKAMLAKRVLELNAEHAAVRALDRARTEDPERARRMVQVLYATALLAAGNVPEDPAAYGELVYTLF